MLSCRQRLNIPICFIICSHDPFWPQATTTRRDTLRAVTELQYETAGRRGTEALLCPVGVLGQIRIPACSRATRPLGP